MSSRQEGGATGRESAPEGKDRDGPGTCGAAPEGKDAGEGNSSDDAAEEKDTHTRDDVLKAMMEEEGFDINATPCGPGGWGALQLPSA